ncbi:XRE family transcriptional regulator [Nonomuraea sp. NPDC005650]|uniref:helix-turn-helix domain-containing protein n=1 Tax=Nonomuraea sp. NPDC005650 TaxID=3157045 RepID=UPI0033A3BDE5
MTSLQDLTDVIASNVRAARQARDWTLDEMAARCGLSRRVIVQIEQGRSNPNIATLLRISDALGLGLPRLVELPESPRPKVVRAGQGPRLWQGAHGGHAHLVGGAGPPDVLELWDWTLFPAESHSSEAHSPGTVEHLLVISGEVRLQVSDEQLLLLAGDAVSFNGDQPHCYANAPDSDGPARFALSVFQPGVGG